MGFKKILKFNGTCIHCGSPFQAANLENNICNVARQFINVIHSDLEEKDLLKSIRFFQYQNIINKRLEIWSNQNELGNL